MPGLSGFCDDNYYRRLDVGQDASHEDIVRAYRRMAMGAHPDAHPEDPGAAGRFREITEAYEVLADPGRRAAYDRRRLGTGAIRVHGTARRAAAEGGSHVAEPIMLGEARRTLGDDVPLRVWPVRVEGADDRGLGSPAAAPWDLGDLFHRMLRSWSRR